MTSEPTARVAMTAACAEARSFHEIYESLAPQFGYTTREETRAFDPDSPNGRLMIAVCAELAQRRTGLLHDAAPTGDAAEAALGALRRIENDDCYSEDECPTGQFTMDLQTIRAALAELAALRQARAASVSVGDAAETLAELKRAYGKKLNAIAAALGILSVRDPNQDALVEEAIRVLEDAPWIATTTTRRRGRWRR